MIKAIRDLRTGVNLHNTREIENTLKFPRYLESPAHQTHLLRLVGQNRLKDRSRYPDLHPITITRRQDA